MAVRGSAVPVLVVSSSVLAPGAWTPVTLMKKRKAWRQRLVSKEDGKVGWADS